MMFICSANDVERSAEWGNCATRRWVQDVDSTVDIHNMVYC